MRFKNHGRGIYSAKAIFADDWNFLKNIQPNKTIDKKQWKAARSAVFKVSDIHTTKPTSLSQAIFQKITLIGEFSENTCPGFLHDKIIQAQSESSDYRRKPMDLYANLLPYLIEEQKNINIF